MGCIVKIEVSFYFILLQEKSLSSQQNLVTHLTKSLPIAESAARTRLTLFLNCLYIWCVMDSIQQSTDNLMYCSEKASAMHSSLSCNRKTIGLFTVQPFGYFMWTGSLFRRNTRWFCCGINGFYVFLWDNKVKVLRKNYVRHVLIVKRIFKYILYNFLQWLFLKEIKILC